MQFERSESSRLEGLGRGGLWRGGLWRGGLWRGGLWRGGVWRGGLWRVCRLPVVAARRQRRTRVEARQHTRGVGVVRGERRRDFRLGDRFVTPSVRCEPARLVDIRTHIAAVDALGLVEL